MLYSMSVVDDKRNKYEICKNVTTEIYKRIDITFAIKELESKVIDAESGSDAIDSNDLSNATDLFAYDKSDSLSSSIILEDGKIINFNNNEELKKPVRRVGRVKKRYRKRVKKKKMTVDCSSDEEPLSRIVGETKLLIKLRHYETDSDVSAMEDDRSKSPKDVHKQQKQRSTRLQNAVPINNASLNCETTLQECKSGIGDTGISIERTTKPGPSEANASRPGPTDLVRSVPDVQPSAGRKEPKRIKRGKGRKLASAAV